MTYRYTQTIGQLSGMTIADLVAAMRAEARAAIDAGEMEQGDYLAYPPVWARISGRKAHLVKVWATYRQEYRGRPGLAVYAHAICSVGSVGHRANVLDDKPDQKHACISCTNYTEKLAADETKASVPGSWGDFLLQAGETRPALLVAFDAIQEEIPPPSLAWAVYRETDDTTKDRPWWNGGRWDAFPKLMSRHSNAFNSATAARAATKGKVFITRVTPLPLGEPEERVFQKEKK